MSSKKFGGYIEVDSMFGASRYYTKLSQSATSAPTNTDYITDFGAVTFTWARTSAGIYTVTANSAIFTANKTHVFIQQPGLGLVEYKVVVTSTTVITLTTSLSSVIATVLTAVATDILLSNTLFKVEVYD